MNYDTGAIHKIFILPNRTSDKWIESNDAQTEISEIMVDKDFCYVPIHIYEDSLIDSDEFGENINYSNRYVILDRKYLNLIQELRISGYRACIWYEEIKDKIPTARSILLSIESKEQLKSSLSKYISCYPFVRLCTMSPKDIKCPSVYFDSELAFNDILISERTSDIIEPPFCENCNGKHLFMREERNYIWEVRCFWSRDKLRAISLPINYNFTKKDRKSIIMFFNNYSVYFPYHSATVDIGKTNDSIELIEFNSFGPDMKATAGNFSWKEDVMILLFSNEPCFK